LELASLIACFDAGQVLMRELQLSESTCAVTSWHEERVKLNPPATAYGKLLRACVCYIDRRSNSSVDGLIQVDCINKQGHFPNRSCGLRRTGGVSASIFSLFLVEPIATLFR
jgi:hypothetical protein